MMIVSFMCDILASMQCSYFNRLYSHWNWFSYTCLLNDQYSNSLSLSICGLIPPEIITRGIPPGWEPLIHPEAAATVCVYVNYAISSRVIFLVQTRIQTVARLLQGPTDDAIYLCVLYIG